MLSKSAKVTDFLGSNIDDVLREYVTKAGVNIGKIEAAWAIGSAL
jgi:hypothetical protein